MAAVCVVEALHHHPATAAAAGSGGIAKILRVRSPLALHNTTGFSLKAAVRQSASPSAPPSSPSSFVASSASMGRGDWMLSHTIPLWEVVMAPNSTHLVPIDAVPAARRGDVLIRPVQAIATATAVVAS